MAIKLKDLSSAEKKNNIPLLDLILNKGSCNHHKERSLRPWESLSLKRSKRPTYHPLLNQGDKILKKITEKASGLFSHITYK